MSEQQSLEKPGAKAASSPLREILEKSTQGPLNINWDYWETTGYRDTAKAVQQKFDTVTKAVEDLKKDIESAPKGDQEAYIALVGELETQKKTQVPSSDEERKKRGAQIDKLGTKAEDIKQSIIRTREADQKAKQDAEQVPKDKIEVDKWIDVGAQLDALDLGDKPPKEKQQLENFRGWAKGFDGTKPMTERQRAQVQKLPEVEKALRAAAEQVQKARRGDVLRARLDGLLPDGATPADLAPNADTKTLDPLVTARGKIETQLRDQKFDEAEAAIAKFRKQVDTALQRLGNLQDKQDGLQQQVTDLNDPGGCKSETENAIAGKRQEIATTLRNPATTENIAAANKLIKELTALIEQGEQETKAQRKQYGARIDPVMKRYRQIEATFDGLRVKGQLDAVRGDYDAVKAAQKKGDWAGAANLAETLDPKLNPIKALADEISAFRGGPNDKLLQGTYEKVIKVLPSNFSVADLKQKLGEVYDEQCMVARLNWMEFLGIAGANVKNGPDEAHYTTFNDAVMKKHAELSVKRSVDELCTDLFESVESRAQIHATVTKRGERYHMYWDGTLSANVNRDRLWETDNALYTKMSKVRDDMIKDMRAKVEAAKRSHGRIGNAKAGPEVR